MTTTTVGAVAGRDAMTTTVIEIAEDVLPVAVTMIVEAARVMMTIATAITAVVPIVGTTTVGAVRVMTMIATATVAAGLRATTTALLRADAPHAAMPMKIAAMQRRVAVMMIAGAIPPATAMTILATAVRVAGSETRVVTPKRPAWAGSAETKMMTTAHLRVAVLRVEMRAMIVAVRRHAGMMIEEAIREIATMTILAIAAKADGSATPKVMPKPLVGAGIIAATMTMTIAGPRADGADFTKGASSAPFFYKIFCSL